MTTKICSRCKIEKDVSLFNKLTASKDGLNYVCRKCAAEKFAANKEKYMTSQKLYVAKNKTLIKERVSVYREKNKDYLSERCAKYYSKNKDKISQKAKEYREKNKEIIAVKKSQYAKNNRLRILDRQRKWNNEKIKTDSVYAAKVRIRNLIAAAFRNKNYTKKSKTFEILGCSYNDFMIHIESQFKDGMSWERIGEIHFDHIVPLATAKTEQDIIKLNHYSNYQPLWAADNLKKGAKITCL
jgi:hypothetical protein